ncbi:MAG: DEAD/DEAH box helicase, partial [Rhodocyclaceae bacterium]
IHLRDYQGEAVRFVARHLATDEPEVLLSSPTGSGKTVMTQAIVARLLADGQFDRCLVVTPQRQIADAFTPADDVLFDSEEGAWRLHAKAWTQTGDDGDARRVAAFLAGRRQSPKVVVTTGAAVVLWSKRRDFLPASLDRALLVVDEAHRAGGQNQLGGRFVAEWRERGGRVLYLSATPYRTDDEPVFGDETRRWTRTMAEHADGEHAPSAFRVDTRRVALVAEDERQAQGEAMAGGDREAAAAEIVAQWQADGRPKSVIIAPALGATEWAEALCDGFAQAGAVTFNAVGPDAGPALTALLDRERGVRDFAESRVDVIVSCRRFDEGTDWPLCSTVYNVGVPGSLGLIVQRWGRAMRSKASIAGYPESQRDLARLVFIVAGVSEDVWERFSPRYRDTVFLLGCMLHDYATAKQYADVVSWRGLGSPIGRSREERDAIEDTVADVAKMVSDERQARASLTMARVEMALRDTGVDRPTLADALDYATGTLKLPADEIAAVREVWGARLLPKQPDARERFDRIVASPGTGALREALDAVVAEHAGAVFLDSGDAREQMAVLSGVAAARIAEDMRARLAISQPSHTAITAAVRMFHAEHGQPPTAKSGDASRYFRWPDGTRTWMAIDAYLRTFGRSLSQATAPLRARPRRHISVTLVDVQAAMLGFCAEHGYAPGASDGDASTYFWMPFGTLRWSAVDVHLHRIAGSSLSRLRKSLGLIRKARGRSAPTIEQPSWDAIVTAARVFHAEHGRAPTGESGDASRYFGWPDGTRTWWAINHQLRKDGSSLSKLCKSLNLTRRTKKKP